MSLLKKWLEKKHYDAVFTGDKEQVIPLIKTFGPDLLFIDVLHKDVIIELEKKGYTDKIPLLLMTGYTHRGYNIISGVADTIEKPFDLKLLQQKIEKLLSSRI